MKIGFHEWTTEKKADFLANLKYAGQYGYECMELLLKNTDAYLETHTIEEMKKALNDAGVRPSALSALLYFNLLTDENRAERHGEFERLCKICEGIGCDTVILVASPAHDIKDKEYIHDDAVDELRQYSRIAEKYGVRGAVEFLGFPWASINDFKQCYGIVLDAGCENIGIALDCCHFYCNGSSIDDLKEADGKRIFAFHIDDSLEKQIGTYTDDSLRVMPGDGVMPMVEILAAAREIGIDETPCLELFCEEIWAWEPEKTFRIGMDKCVAMFEKLSVSS